MNGPPQKPTTALSAGSSRADDADRLQHRAERLVGLRQPQPLDVRGRPDRLVDDGADALDELDVDAHGQDGGHDVGEHHGGVHVVPPHRLQRHLGAQLRVRGQLEETVPLPQRAVLGQRPPRLAHEPHRRPLDGLPAAGTDEQRFRLGHPPSTY